VASNYEVNIKLDTKQAKNQLRELEERITKLNRMALSGKASRQAAQESREKLKLTNLELKNDLALLKVKEGELKLDKQSFLLEKQKSKAVAGTNKQLKQVKNTQDKIRNPKAIGPSSPLNFTNEGTLIPGAGLGGSQTKSKGILSSALISGSFPLLFGQGIPGAIAGGLGGGLGAKFGGQTGGFAGGLVATAALQILNNIKDSVNQFGAELNDPTENLDALTARIKKFDKSIETSISTLKNAGLDQVAGELASLTMQQQFQGLDSVKNLNKEMTKFQQGAADLTTRLSILVAGPLTLLFKTLNLIGGSASKAAEGLTTTQAIDEQKKKLEEDLARKERFEKAIAENKEKLSKIPAIQSSGSTAQNLKINIAFQERELKLINKSIQGNQRILEIRELQRKVLLSEGLLLEGQINLERLKADVTRGNINEKAVAIEQKRIDMLKVENKLLIAKENLKSMVENKATKGEIEAQEEKIKNLEREFTLVQMIGNERINAADPAISRMDELNRKMRDLNDTTLQAVNLSKAIGESFEESFKGIIKGTMTVQDAFRNMLNRIADFFLDAAAQLAATQLQRGILGLFSNIFNFSTTPLNDIQNTNVKFAANGGPVGMRKPYIVGERGPELFVPNQSGNIIPNHDLAGVGGGSTNIVVNVDASGSSVEGDEEQGRELGRMISVAIQSELIKQKRPGGMLA